MQYTESFKKRTIAMSTHVVHPSTIAAPVIVARVLGSSSIPSPIPHPTRAQIAVLYTLPKMAVFSPYDCVVCGGVAHAHHCGVAVSICVAKMYFMRCCWSSPQRRALRTRAAGASRKQRAAARSRTPPLDMPRLPARRWIWCSGCASRSISASAGSGHPALHLEWLDSPPTAAQSSIYKWRIGAGTLPVLSILEPKAPR